MFICFAENWMKVCHTSLRSFFPLKKVFENQVHLASIPTHLDNHSFRKTDWKSVDKKKISFKTEIDKSSKIYKIHLFPRKW